MNSYVYVIASDPAGPVKLGSSKHPEKRVKQLQTGHSEQLRLYYFHSIPAENVKLMEKAVHEVNRHNRIKGEWYNLSVEDAILEVRHAVIRYSENLELIKQKVY